MFHFSKSFIKLKTLCYSFHETHFWYHLYYKNIANYAETLSAMRIKSSLLHTSSVKLNFRDKNDLLPSDKQTLPREIFFKEVENKDKKTFLKILENFKAGDRVKRGHVEFIYAALKCMEDYEIQGDLEVYKQLMDVFPKGKMIPRNLIQAEFYHFPRQQECAVMMLDQMEYYGICPDREMSQLIQTIFGKSSHVYKKIARMLYWMPKLKNINPYMLPDPVPNDVQELARFALKKMSVDIRTKIVEYDAKVLADSAEETWILSAQSPAQQNLIKEHCLEKSLYIEGPFLVWLRKISITYFVLRADPKVYPKEEVDYDDVSKLSNFMFGDPMPKELTLAPSTVHEQEDGIIMAMCCTGTSSKDSLLSWIRFLKETNPRLDDIPVLFKLKSSPSSLVSMNAPKDETEKVVDHVVN